MNWYNFWQNYRPIKEFNTENLLYQVGKTKYGKPISQIEFRAIVNDINKKLELNKEDILIDLCCGNGILTKELSQNVEQIYAIDFSEMFIKNAILYNNKINIQYLNSDIMNIGDIIFNNKINTVLMYDALASFNKQMLTDILILLKNIITPNAKILIGAIPDITKKFKFYNTLKLKWYYFYNFILLQKNNGIGRWWHKNEIIEIASETGYTVEFITQNTTIHTAHYRFDVLIKLKHAIN